MLELLFPVAVLTSGALFGGLILFAGVIAPLAFSKLPRDTASAFMTAVFPVFYLAAAGTAGVAAAAAYSFDRSACVLLAVACVFLLFSRFWVVPRIDRARQAASDGDVKEAGRFARLHRASFMAYLAVMLISALAVIDLARTGGTILE